MIWREIGASNPLKNFQKKEKKKLATPWALPLNEDSRGQIGLENRSKKL
jgi:hypothetical protein